MRKPLVANWCVLFYSEFDVQMIWSTVWLIIITTILPRVTLSPYRAHRGSDRVCCESAIIVDSRPCLFRLLTAGAASKKRLRHHHT